ncbi:MAG: S-adenosylmethionine synthetase N-terminal domain-containing protein [Candidatus Uhrbacteria bacterium]|nr:S-adenosylmethionine synthetase N-terminal domain-containing protein [Candidatus Uhrbacteria bacterium]
MSLSRVRGPGHPDQTCDLVVSSIVEEYLRRDPAARLKVYACGGQGALFVAGEIFSSVDFDVSAIVRRALGQSGVTVPMEPFIAFEPMASARVNAVGSREVTTVIGYATDETRDYVPRTVEMARDAARELERRRVSDPDWFWLGADYTVMVDDHAQKTLIVIHAEHVPAENIEDVRARITELLLPRFAGATIRVNLAGEEVKAGLGSRMGGSGRGSAQDQYGSPVPANVSGVGFHLDHPSNVGTWLARSVAKELVAAKRGKAVMVQATWLPLEARPHAIRARNEKGENLSSFIAPDRFDLSRIPSEFLAPSLATASIRHAFDGSIELPWEN